METIRDLVAQWGVRSIAAAVAALLFVFCLSSAAPADSASTGCQGPDPSPRMCGQPGVVTPLVALAPQVPQVDWQRTVFVGLRAAPLGEAVHQFPVDPSAPRAPPVSF